jgi:maleylpyruvate isomerase
LSVTADRQHLQWWIDGERTVAGLVDRLSDDELAAPSPLPGWSRASVVAHLARNADALVNLLHWARTGVETPMYPSWAVREAAIAATAALPVGDLRADYVAACARLAAATDSMPAEAWTTVVRNGQGRPLPTREVPWMRAKELWVHGTDLRAGLSFADLPVDFCTGGATVQGPVAAVAVWLTRSDASGLDGDVPPPPAWL